MKYVKWIGLVALMLVVMLKLWRDAPPYPVAGQEWECVHQPPCVNCDGVLVHPPGLVVNRVEDRNVYWTGTGEKNRSHGMMTQETLWNHFRIKP